MSDNILIIEDSNTQAQQVAAHLSAYDIDVLIASDGPQGLRLITAQKPSLIVLDINLPTMNGYQVCRRLKRDPKTANIPVIMLSSRSEAEGKMQGISAGAVKYIPKGDFAIDDLLATLAELGIIEKD